MSVKPNNVVPVLKDHVVNVFHDFSSAIDNTGKPVFVDAKHDWEVVDVTLHITVAHSATSQVYDIGHSAYLASDGVTVVAADPDHFVANYGTGASVKALGSVIQLTQTTTPKLPKGAPLTITSASTVNTGEGILSIRLRPYTPSVGNSGKRPKAAQSPV